MKHKIALSFYSYGLLLEAVLSQRWSVPLECLILCFKHFQFYSSFQFPLFPITIQNELNALVHSPKQCQKWKIFKQLGLEYFKSTVLYTHCRCNCANAVMCLCIAILLTATGTSHDKTCQTSRAVTDVLLGEEGIP